MKLSNVFILIIIFFFILGDLAIPAWAIIVLVGIGQLIVGGVVFFIMKKIIVDTPITGSYTPAETIDVEA